MAAQNAELMGHGGGPHKISYVDGVRREMALVKQVRPGSRLLGVTKSGPQELVSTRVMLNTANDRIKDLTEEVAAYKTIDGDLGASTRKRIVRRQPEGSAVVLSTSRRSVSGPVRR